MFSFFSFFFFLGGGGGRGGNDKVQRSWIVFCVVEWVL